MNVVLGKMFGFNESKYIVSDENKLFMKSSELEDKDIEVEPTDEKNSEN